MSPVDICVRQIDQALGSTRSTLVDDVAGALDVLEASFISAGERVVALESVIHVVSIRRKSSMKTPVGRFIFHVIDQRQNKILVDVA